MYVHYYMKKKFITASFYIVVLLQNTLQFVRVELESLWLISRSTPVVVLSH